MSEREEELVNDLLAMRAELRQAEGRVEQLKEIVVRIEDKIYDERERGDMSDRCRLGR